MPLSVNMTSFKCPPWLFRVARKVRTNDAVSMGLDSFSKTLKTHTKGTDLLTYSLTDITQPKPLVVET